MKRWIVRGFFVGVLLMFLGMSTGCWASRGAVLGVMIQDESLRLKGQELRTTEVWPWASSKLPSASTELYSTLPPDEIIAWYREQLPKHGWTIDARNPDLVVVEEQKWEDDHRLAGHFGLGWPEKYGFRNLAGFKMYIGLDRERAAKEKREGTWVYVTIEEGDPWVYLLWPTRDTEGGWWLLPMAPLVLVW